MNVVTFLAFTVDFFLCMVNPDLDNSAANSLILDVFPIAGGAVGMLLALFVWGGLGRGHRMNKDNIAWWFLAIVCLIVWGLVVAAKFGLITLDASIGGILSGWDLDKLKIMGIYLAVVNVITLIAFVWDKYVAESGLREACSRGALAWALPRWRLRWRNDCHERRSPQDQEMAFRLGFAIFHHPGHRSGLVCTHGRAHIARLKCLYLEKSLYIRAKHGLCDGIGRARPLDQGA